MVRWRFLEDFFLVHFSQWKNCVICIFFCCTVQYDVIIFVCSSLICVVFMFSLHFCVFVFYIFVPIIIFEWRNYSCWLNFFYFFRFFIFFYFLSVQENNREILYLHIFIIYFFRCVVSEFWTVRLFLAVHVEESSLVGRNFVVFDACFLRKVSR